MAHTTVEAEPGGSALARLIPIIVGISVLGFLVLVIGDVAGIEGADEGEEGSFVFDIAWVSFSLGAIIALVAGVVALLKGHRSHRADEERAGKIGIGYFLLAVIITAITASLT